MSDFLAIVNKRVTNITKLILCLSIRRDYFLFELLRKITRLNVTILLYNDALQFLTLENSLCNVTLRNSRISANKILLSLSLTKFKFHKRCETIAHR